MSLPASSGSSFALKTGLPQTNQSQVRPKYGAISS